MLKERYEKWTKEFMESWKEFGVRIDIWTHLMRGCIIGLCTLI